jgi:hypothetical protein
MNGKIGKREDKRPSTKKKQPEAGGTGGNL